MNIIKSHSLPALVHIERETVKHESDRPWFKVAIFVNNIELEPPFLARSKHEQLREYRRLLDLLGIEE